MQPKYDSIEAFLSALKAGQEDPSTLEADWEYDFRRYADNTLVFGADQTLLLKTDSSLVALALLQERFSIKVSTMV